MSTSTLGPKQRLFLRESNARINTMCGAIRSGKTHVSLLRWIKHINAAPRGDLIMTGKTLGTLKRNVLNPLQDMLGCDMSYSIGNNMARIWGKRIYCFGADNESSEGKIRGMTVAGAYQDEITLSPISYFKTTLGRMSPDGAKYFGTTNTDSPYHPFKTEYLDRAEKDKLNLVNWNFLLDDNPSLSQEFKNNIKREYVGMWYRRFIEGLWIAAEGAVYDFFDEKEHTFTLAEIKKKFTPQYFIVGVDYGTSGVTVFILFGINRQPDSPWKIVALKELFYDAQEKGEYGMSRKQKSDYEFCDDMKLWLGPKIIPMNVIVDPSCQSLQVQLRQQPFNFSGVIDAQNSIIDGIRLQATYLKRGHYVLCREGCPRTIQDYSGYVWDKKKQLEGKDMPASGPCEHTKDAERYGIYTTFGGQTLDINALATY